MDTNPRSRFRKFIVDLKKFDVLQTLKSGAFGSVSTVKDHETGNIYAAKVLITHENEAQYKKMINHGIEIMIRSQHPTIIRFHGYSLTDFHNENNVTIIMELGSKGSLFEYLEKVRTGLSEDPINNTIRQKILVGISRGMIYLHQHNIIHYNLKPGHILLDEDFHPHITDIGLHTSDQSNISGSSIYMAPEVIEGNKYTRKADVYSFGIIMYEVITGLYPYPLLQSKKLSPFKFNNMVVGSNYRPEFTVPVKKSIKNLIEKCWSKDPSQRPTFEDLFKKLAYNIDDSTDEEEEEEKGTKYYLDDADAMEVLFYAGDIDVQESTSNSNEIAKEIKGLRQSNKELKEEIAGLRDEIENLKKNNLELKSQNRIPSFIQMTVAEFNLLPLGDQRQVILQIIAVCDDRNRVSHIKKLGSLLLFLSELGKDAQNKRLLEINPRREGQLCTELEKDQCICLLFNAAELLLKSGALVPEKFNDQFVMMPLLKIEAKYPSPSFKSVYDQVVSIKNSLEDKSKIQLGVVICGVNETDQQFHKDENINCVRIGSSVTSIKSAGDDGSFEECYSLTQITIPSSVTSIGNSAFKGCSSLTQITIPSSVTSIEEGTFNGCSSLTQITIPSSVISIGNSAFNGCSSLTQIPAPFSVTGFTNNFPECFSNKNLEEALKSIFTSINNKRSVILTGSEGSGITQVAKWVAKFYNMFNSNKSNEEFFCVCNEETKFSDLIGVFNPLLDMHSEQNQIIFRPGLLISAIQHGKCVVFDSINEASLTLIERLTDFLDEKKIFEIPEYNFEKQIDINTNFRILCTCKKDKINQISPAFVEKFDIIVLENQLENITDDKLKELIELLMKVKLEQYKSYFSSNKENDYDFSFESDDDGDNDDDDELNVLEPSSDLVNIVFKSFDRILTMLNLSLLCKAVIMYANLFSNICSEGSSVISQETIVKFATDLLMKTDDFDVPKEIESFIIDKFTHENSIISDEKYFFDYSVPLRSFISKLYAASIINLPIIIYETIGVGKTSAAKAIGRMRLNNHNIPYLMHLFHTETKPSNIYGTTTIINNKIVTLNGPLTTALLNGNTFIADEMNLSSISTIKSLAPALEPCIGEKVFISNIGETIKIHPNFFFIACLDELKDIIPPSIASRFKVLRYPNLQKEDLSTLCLNIYKNLYNYKGYSDIQPSLSCEDARNVGKYLINLNTRQIIPQWSLHDVTKLFKRIRYQDEKKYYFHNLSFYHNVLFYTLSPICESELNQIFDRVLDLIAHSFYFDTQKKYELERCYYDRALIRFIEKGSYIMKGESGINISLLPQIYKLEFSPLPSLLECIFKIILSDPSESILLIGPSSYKTFISKFILHNVSVINSTQEITISQLIGEPTLFTQSEANLFYLDLICKISHIYDSNKITELKDKLSKRQLVKSDIITETQKYLQIYPFATVIHRLTDKLFENNTDNNDQDILSDMIIEFKPGLVLSPILQGNSIILKNISDLQPSVIKRFNELLKGKHSLTISEDIYNTITYSDTKEFSGFCSRVFSTCHSNSVAKLPDSILRNFTIIIASEYTKDEQENVNKSVNDTSTEQNNIGTSNCKLFEHITGG